MEEGLTLSKREEKRANVVVGIQAKELTVTEGAALLGLSERQVWRLLRAYRAEGLRGLAHRNRGRMPPHRTSDAVRARVVTLAQGVYDGANDSHLTDLLKEREGLALSRPTVRRILREAGVRSPRRHRSPQHRSRRERFPEEGMLLQIDGSFHPWLEARGPKLCLIGAIDDATGQIAAAVFREREDTQGYFLMLQQVLQSKGIPQALYSDRHSIFQRSPQDPETLAEQLAGRRRPTQFGEALEALGIALVLAHSPQAKGRIERLWGTLQSRLVVELRLAAVTSLEEANQFITGYLPRFNKEFRVPPAQPGLAYRPLDPAVALEEVLCFKYHRTVGLDNTVTLDEQVFQLVPGAAGRSYARRHVEIQERLDGSTVILCQGQRVGSRAAPAGPVTLRARRDRGELRTESKNTLVHSPSHLAQAQQPHEKPRALGYSTPPKPGPNHPWRRYQH